MTFDSVFSILNRTRSTILLNYAPPPSLGCEIFLTHGFFLVDLRPRLGHQLRFLEHQGYARTDAQLSG